MTIEITGLTYTYANRDTPALRDVSLTFRAGEVTLLAGKSGSGKTTLIRCINGLIPHAYKNGTLTGQIRCFGESTGGLSLAQLASRVGTVMQDPDKQIVSTRVFNELAFGLENLGLPREQILLRVYDAARMLHIEPLLQRETHSLSGGEQQKVVIAAVLAMQPSALLLDEPLASLDPPSAHEALLLFRQLADSGVAVVMIEHRVAEALRIEPEQCIALVDGSVAFDGDAPAFRRWRQAKASENQTAIAKREAFGNTSLLSLHEVKFGYENTARVQLHRVSLDVRDGDVMALMGANGAGKSTLCRLAVGLLRPNAGRILADGEDTANMTVAQIVRKVGYVFQNPAVMLFANTLREELSFGPRNIRMPAEQIEPAIADAMRIVGLGDIPLDRSPFGLSYGQQKRVAVAAVLAMQPRVLILDEPTAGLDDNTAEDMLERLMAGTNGPRAILMVTHDLPLARHVANRAVLLADGHIIAEGTPGEVLDNAHAMRAARLAAPVLTGGRP